MPSVYPGEPLGLPDPTGISINSELSVAPDPGTARIMSDRIVSDLSSLSGAIERNDHMIRQMNGSISKLASERNRLRSERDKVLEDYKHGYFCNQCWKAKSEFSSEADFWQHIAEGRESGRHAVPASQEQIDAKKAEYERKLQAIDSQVRQLQQAVHQKQIESKSAYNQMQQGINFWQTATSIERAALKAREDSNQREYKRRISEAEQRLRDLDRLGQQKNRIDGLSPKTLRQTWEKMRDQASQEATLDASEYSNNVRETDLKQQQEYSQILKCIGQTDDYVRSMKSTLQLIPNLNVSLPLPNNTSAWLYSSPDQLGLRFQFGRIPVTGSKTVAIGLEISNSEVSQEANAFVESFRKRLQVGWQTQYGVRGVNSGPTAYFGGATKPSGNPVKVSRPKTRDIPGKSLPIP